ncbi:TetR/AcrR family transcriptional regulator [Mycobacterium sp. NPDC049093]
MPTQPKYSMDDFLDAAAGVLAAGGPDALTLSAVLRATGAPSGSLYYRFPDRPALLGALWRRTVADYHDATRTGFDGPAESAVCAAVQVARDTVRWCRNNPDAAAVLLAGRRALGAEQWPAELRISVDSENVVRDKQTRQLVKSVRAETGMDLDAVLLAVIDLPYAAVRRYIAARRDLPLTLENTVAKTMETILSVDDRQADRGGLPG